MVNVSWILEKEKKDREKERERGGEGDRENSRRKTNAVPSCVSPATHPVENTAMRHRRGG